MSRRETAIRRLGEKVREAREARGLSTQELGDTVGLSSQQIRRIERGLSEATGVVLGRIARAVGAPVEELLDHVRTIEELASSLWEKHQLDAKLEGSDEADFLAKKSILTAMGLWEE